METLGRGAGCAVALPEVALRTEALPSGSGVDRSARRGGEAMPLAGTFPRAQEIVELVVKGRLGETVPSVCSRSGGIPSSYGRPPG